MPFNPASHPNPFQTSQVPDFTLILSSTYLHAHGVDENTLDKLARGTYPRCRTWIVGFEIVYD